VDDPAGITSVEVVVFVVERKLAAAPLLKES
jgi:hypothetical protein